MTAGNARQDIADVAAIPLDEPTCATRPSKGVKVTRKSSSGRMLVWRPVLHQDFALPELLDAIAGVAEQVFQNLLGVLTANWRGRADSAGRS